MARINRRRNYLIDKKFQLSFIITFSLIVIAGSLIVGFLIVFLSRGLTTVTVENAKVLVKSTSDFLLPIAVQTVIIVSIFSAAVVVVLTLITSHRISGPLYRMKKEVELLKKGNFDVKFKIRRKDKLQHMAGSLSELAASLRKRDSLLKNKILKLKDTLEKSPGNKDLIGLSIAELEDAMKKFGS